MRIAFTGRDGQVARAVSELGGRLGHEVVLLGRPALDLADPATIAPVIRGADAKPVIIAGVCSANIAVDLEIWQKLCFRRHTECLH